MKLVLSIFIAVFSLKALAQDVDFSAQLSLLTDLKKISEDTKSYSTNLSATASTKLKDLAVSINFNIDKDLDGLRNETINDGSLIFGHEITKYKSASLSATLLFALPISEASRKESNKITSLTLSTPLSINLKAVGLKYISLGYIPSYSEAFYQTQRVIAGPSTGRANTKRQLANTLTLTYSPIEKLSFNLSARNRHRWTSQGNRQQDLFGHSQSATYLASKQASVTLGHETEMRTFGYTGNSIDLNATNNNSIIYTTFGYIF